MRVRMDMAMRAAGPRSPASRARSKSLSLIRTDANARARLLAVHLDHVDFAAILRQGQSELIAQRFLERFGIAGLPCEFETKPAGEAGFINHRTSEHSR